MTLDINNYSLPFNSITKKSQESIFAMGTKAIEKQKPSFTFPSIKISHVKISVAANDGEEKKVMALKGFA
jgi:hypothetical protein